MEMLQTRLASAVTGLRSFVRRYPAILIAAAWLLIVGIVRLFAISMIHQVGELPQTTNLLVQGAVKFDANHFLLIATQGYPAPPSGLYAFYPVFPLLARLISQSTSLGLISAGLVVNSLATLAASQGLYLLSFKLTKQRRLALITVLVWLAFPSAHFLAAFYTEALFGALTVWALYFALQNKYGWASLLAGLATGARLPGIVIGLAIALHYLQQRNFKLRRIDWQAAWLPLSWSGIGLYWLWIWGTTGANPLIFMQHTYAQFWSYNQFQPNILLTLGRQLKLFFTLCGSAIWVDNWVGPWLTHLQFVLGWLAVAGAAVWSWRKSFPLLLTSYATGMALLLLLTGNVISASRYALPVFPLFILLAIWLSQLGEGWRTLYFVGSALMLGVMLTLFSNGYWVG